MDRKMALHMKMTVAYGLYKLYLKQWRLADRDIDLWDEAHGFGFEDEWTITEYERTHKCDEFQELWNREQSMAAEWKDQLDDFCNLMVEFTDGQVDYKTAREMATNPRWKDRLEAAMYGKAAGR